MNNITIQIPYGIIVRNEQLCRELGVNERCVNEGVVDADDTKSVTITQENRWVLIYLYDYLEN